MDSQQSLGMFINRLARKIAALYPNNCADKEDYIQAGYLKLAEINGDKHKKHNFKAYAVVAIARSMRKTALGAMGAASAPERIKRLVHKIELLIVFGNTEQDICHELKIDTKTLFSLKSLINAESWHRLFEEPTYDSKPFSILDDLLSSCCLTDKERKLILSQLSNTTDDLCLSRNQLYKNMKNVRLKLMRSGYGA